ncbi:hypothetical protein [uncultured Sphingomonas sp.]|uniref:hypothetical protein n=1 Tax=uncultured Sphingomonas sp. TaxID=158754 RepID=UPI0035CB8ACF
MRAVLIVAMIPAALLASCHQRHSVPAHGDTPGDRLEAAAQAAGVVADPAHADPIGSYGRDNDRLCVVPGGAGAYRIGVLVRFEDGQGCTARGTATRSGDRLDMSLDMNLDGEPCRVAARFEGDRIVLPAELPPGCDRRCTGRASLAALDVERLSDGTAEATAQVDGKGNPLCGG